MKDYWKSRAVFDLRFAGFTYALIANVLSLQTIDEARRLEAQYDHKYHFGQVRELIESAGKTDSTKKSGNKRRP